MDTLLIKCLDNCSNEYKNIDLEERIKRNDSGFDLFYSGETIHISPFETCYLRLGIACEL